MIDLSVRCSVIIPTYNCLNYLKIALQSVTEQLYRNYELIVVDDGSSDGTWAWLQTYQANSINVKIVKGKGRGPAHARNLAVSHSTAPYIAFLDADDQWSAQKLANQMSIHNRHPELGFSFGDYLHQNELGENLGTCFEFWPSYKDYLDLNDAYVIEPKFAAHLFAQNGVGTSTVVVKRSLFLDVGGFDEDLVSAEDWDLWIKLALAAPVAVLRDSDCTYLMRSDSHSSAQDQRIQALSQIIARYQHHFKLPQRAIAQARLLIAKAEYSQSKGKKWMAFAYRLSALSFQPTWRTSRELIANALPGRRS
ncbi:glycosyltransferase family 2 protein [Alginatibacterium sediminis]|nr:glycosyltransferase family A protein [Alginatibacterium sediminis]